MSEEFLVLWQRCESKGCPNMVCSWASLTLCFPCEENIVGTEEMHARYGQTHEHPWDSNRSPNRMTKTFQEIMKPTDAE